MQTTQRLFTGEIAVGVMLIQVAHEQGGRALVGGKLRWKSVFSEGNRLMGVPLPCVKVLTHPKPRFLEHVQKVPLPRPVVQGY